jgi:hypothetical protein
MVSGIEAAGLILAVFPLVISALEDYGGCVESMKDWVRFKANYVVYLNSLNRQKIFFRQNIEDLLSSVVESGFDMARMLEDPDDAAWKASGLEDKLRMRLSRESEYECYMEIMFSFLSALKKLESKLHIEPHQVRRNSSERQDLQKPKTDKIQETKDAPFWN